MKSLCRFLPTPVFFGGFLVWSSTHSAAAVLLYLLPRACERCSVDACHIQQVSSTFLIAFLCFGLAIPIGLLLYTRWYRPNPRKPRRVLPWFWAAARWLWFVVGSGAAFGLFQVERKLCSDDPTGIVAMSATLFAMVCMCKFYIHYISDSWSLYIEGPEPKRDEDAKPPREWLSLSPMCVALMLFVSASVLLALDIITLFSVKDRCETGCARASCSLFRDATSATVGHLCLLVMGIMLLLLCNACFDAVYYHRNVATARRVLHILWILLFMGWCLCGVLGSGTAFVAARFLCSGAVPTEAVAMANVCITIVGGYFINALDPKVQSIICGRPPDAHDENLLEREFANPEYVIESGEETGSEDTIVHVKEVPVAGNISQTEELRKRGE